MSEVKKFTLELPVALSRDVDFAARAKGLTRNGLIRKLLETFTLQTVPHVRRELHEKQQRLAEQGVTISIEELLAANRDVKVQL